MKLSDYHQSATKRVLIVGLSGTGKSTLAAELAEHGFNLTWLNIENAADTLQKLSPAAQDRINLVHIPDSASYPIAAETCLNLFKRGKASICDIHGKCDCSVCRRNSSSFSEVDTNIFTGKDILVLDSATQLSSSILSFTTKGQPVDFKPERDDWGALRKYTEFFKSQFQGAAYNLIVICQATTAELENGVEKLVPQFGSKGMSANFGSAFDHVVYMDIKNGKHKAYSKSTALPGVLTRSRSDFDIEKQSELSLFPIFEAGLAAPTKEPIQHTESSQPDGEKPSEATKTPAETSVSNLASLLANMKGKK